MEIVIDKPVTLEKPLPQFPPIDHGGAPASGTAGFHHTPA
jgi:hypothetical protein